MGSLLYHSYLQILLSLLFSHNLLSNIQSFGLIFTTGPKPKVKEDDFEELLSTQGFASRPDKKGPRTIAEMRREEMTKEIDPFKLQVLVN